MTNNQHAACVPLDDEDILAPEVRALRLVLARVMGEVTDAESLATHVSRVASVSVQAARARHAIGASGMDQFMEYLNPLLKDLDRQAATTSPGRALTTGEGKYTP